MADTLLQPDQYARTPVRDLLSAAARGLIGVDHRFVRAILERYEEATPALVEFGLEERDDLVPLDLDILALFRHRPTAASLPLLVEYFRSATADPPDELVEAFCRLGEAGVVPLLELYRELGAENGSEVAFVLAAIRSRDPRVLELLQERAALDQDEGKFLLEIHAEPEGEAEPYDIWDDYPETAGPRFDLLTLPEKLRFLESPLTEHRAEAVASIGLEYVEGEAQARLFRLAQHDPEPLVRGNCWSRLIKAHEVEEIRSAMLGRLRDPGAPLRERCGALIGLSWEAEDPEIRRYILEFYGIPEARPKAMEAMWRSMDPAFAAYFPRHLDDPDLETRREAIMGVGYFRMHAEAARIEKYFYHEELRIDALYAYALAAPGKVNALHARQVLTKVEQLAGGLSLQEADLVEKALDDLLELHGREPIFSPDADWEDEDQEPAAAPKPGRNDPCPCGSGKKYKKCCGQ